jgi:6-pyruvoyl-tetrahydropterin synthase
MVLDFADIDGVVKPILERMDHHFLVGGDEPVMMDMVGAFGRAADMPEHFCAVGVRTTAENLAVWLWKQIVPLMTQTQNIELLGVKVQETPNTFAEFIAEVRPAAAITFDSEAMKALAEDLPDLFKVPVRFEGVDSAVRSVSQRPSGLPFFGVE